LDGCSTVEQPYVARRKLLEELELEGPACRTPRNFIGQPEAVLESTEQCGLEGVVAKRLESPYKPGARSGAWVKHKHRRRESLLITAWAPAQPGRPESFFLARRLGDGGLEPEESRSVSQARSASAYAPQSRPPSCRTEGAASECGRSNRR
jgi:ATP-dependent DNA ligase